MLLALAVLEVSLRIGAEVGRGHVAAGLRQWDPYASVELRGAHCFRAWPGSTLRYPNGTAAHVDELGFRGPAVAITKPAGTSRVLLLGGSTRCCSTSPTRSVPPGATCATWRAICPPMPSSTTAI